MFVIFVLLSVLAYSQANDGIDIKDQRVDVDPYRIVAARQYPGRQIFDFQKNGLRVNIKIVPSPKNDTSKEDNFPEFPTKDIGRCIIHLSLVCAKKRLNRFIESMKELNEIHLMGQQIKLVKTRVINSRRSINGSNDSIERSVNDFFDTFALRITLPRWNGRSEKNQIDLMLDETAIAEGRGKKGGGGGKGGGKGDKCKMMMMAGLMMLKMKLMGIATMKGMMMAGMSLMISMVMYMNKYMKGGDYHPSGGGGQYKEIVLLTKSNSGSGGSSPDSYYGSPPSNNYGPPPDSGGWGRSFGKRFIITDKSNQNNVSTNASINTERPISSVELVDYQNHTHPFTNSNYNYSDWNSSVYEAPQSHRYLNNDVDVGNNSDPEPLLRPGSDNYVIDTDPYRNVDSRVDEVDPGSVDYADNVERVDSKEYKVNNYDRNAVKLIYGDEWRAMEGKKQSINFRREMGVSEEDSRSENSSLGRI